MAWACLVMLREMKPNMRGSAVTYYFATREKRIISEVRSRMDIIGALLSANEVLTEAQYRKLSEASEALVSDKQILKISQLG